MKSLPCLVILAAAALSHAQNTAEQRIQGTYQNLRTNEGIYFAVTGTDRIGNDVTPIGTNLYYQTQVVNGRSQLRMNLVDYVSRRGVPNATLEVVADGRNLWRYDRLLRTYSVTPYDVPNPADESAQSPTFLRDAVYALNQATSGSGRSSYAARLVKEVFSDPQTAQYRSWMPGRTPYEAASYHDPINNYDVAQPNCTYVIYPTDGRRSIAFEIYTNPDTTVDSLQRVYVTEQSQYGGRRRIISYTIAPLVTNDFSSARFTPYDRTETQGWRPVVAPKSSRG